MTAAGGFDVRPHAPGVPPDLLARFAAIDTATIGHVTDRGFVAGVRPLFTPVRLLGRAVTVQTPASCGAVLRDALIVARPGDVLVVDMTGDPGRACWGELRTLAARIKGVAGVVVHGCVTDSRAVRALAFPAFSRGVSAITTRGGGTTGAVNIPLRIDGVTVSSGDLVIGDDDGLFVIAQGAAAELARACERKAQQDEERRRALQAARSRSGAG